MSQRLFPTRARQLVGSSSAKAHIRKHLPYNRTQDGFLWLTVDAFRNAVAPDATEEETSLMAANQKPIALKCLGEPMGRPAWKQKPSWFLIAENDRMVSPSTQRFLAERMHSIIVLLPADHVLCFPRPRLFPNSSARRQRAEQKTLLRRIRSLIRRT